MKLHLGFDFGTCFTKLCYRNLQMRNSPSFLVCFPSGEFLIPSVVGIDYDGRLVAGLTESEWAARNDIRTKVRFLKMHLSKRKTFGQDFRWAMKDVQSDFYGREDEIRALSAFHIYSILRNFRNWVIPHLYGEKSKAKLDFSVSLGTPSQYSEDSLRKSFAEVLRTAYSWLDLPEEQVPRTLADALQLQSKDSSEKYAANCNAMPEIVAAMQYLFSSPMPNRKSCLFFDVGGGTLDAVAFRLRREGDGPYINIYSGSVEPFGIDALSLAACQRLGWNDSRPIEAYLFQKNDRNNGTVSDELLLPERKSLLRQVGLVLHDALQKDPQAFKHADNGPFIHMEEPIARFWGGGGAQSPFYQRAVEESHHRFRNNRIKIAENEKLPIPPKSSLEFNNIPKALFNRFVVAYGLSLLSPGANSLNYLLPTEFDSINPNVRNIPRPEDHFSASD